MLVDVPSGLTLALDRHGDDGAPAVLLLHGLSGARDAWTRVVDALSPGVTGGRWQVLAIDLRGHGDSSRAGSVTDYRATAYAEDIAGLIEVLDLAPAVVVGHSLGGLTAAALASAHPSLVRGVLLEDPPHFEGDAAVRNASPVAAFFPKLVAAVRALQAASAPAVDYLPLVRGTVDPADEEQRCGALRRWDPTTMEAAIGGVVWEGFDPLATIAVPMTIVAADPAAGAVFKPHDGERVLGANPGARLATIAGASHNVHAPATLDAFLAELSRFLDEVLPAGERAGG